MTLIEQINDYLKQEVAVLNSMNQNNIEEVISVFLQAFETESTIYVFGNGGSASTASHMANDFNKGISEYTDKKFRICCLNDNVATILAIANDIGYDDIFSFQLKNKMKPGDIALGISGSGNSKNVINALSYSKSVGCKTIGWVGFSGGVVSEISDVVCHVQINNMQIVEDVHLILNHLMMYTIMQQWNIKPYC